MKISSEIVDNTLTTLLKGKYPELSYESQMYDANVGEDELFPKYNIWISAPVGFYGTKSSYDDYYDEVEKDIKNILKMFGVFKGVNFHWLESDTTYYKD